MQTKDIVAQSKAAYGQWAKQWREHASYHSKFKMKSLRDLENTGIGKTILCVANGYSFEENIDIIKKYQHNIDILACDKTFGHLVSHGITPKYLMVCDANVDYDTYLKPYLDKTSETILFINVCGNPKWTTDIKWKDIYFFANKDVLKSEQEFCKLSGCPNTIPAATNVSNAMVVFLTQSDNEGQKNYFGYDKICLIGFDYSWRHGKKYYAFDELASNKSHYMCHAYITTFSGEFAYTSGNLAFSANWLAEYAKAFRLPLIQCSKATITTNIKFGDLETQLKYKYKPEDAVTVRKQVDHLRVILKQKREIEKQLTAIGRDHWSQHIATS